MLSIIAASLLGLVVFAPAEESSPAGIIRQYTGRFPRIDAPLMKAAHARDMAVSGRFYGPGTADWDQKAAQVALNAETAEYLYTRFTPLRLGYRAGSRPVLERVVGRITHAGMSDREKAFAILKYCHNGFRKDYPPIPLPKGTIYLNATEEDILVMGGGQCEDRSRLIICLMQIAGIPARFVASSTWFNPKQGYADCGGHAIVEFCVEGGWAFADSLRDFYCLRQDGKIASLWDLVRNGQLVESQPESVYRECGSAARWSRDRTRAWFAEYRDAYLRPNHVITLTNYCVWDYGRYDWKWVPLVESPGTPAAEELARFCREQRRKSLLEAGVPAEKIK